MSGGPAYWTRSVLRDVWLNGLLLSGYSSLGWQPKRPAAVVIDMADGGSVVQRPYRGGTAPAALVPLTMSLALIPLSEEDEHAAIQRTETRGALVWFFPELPLTDTWDSFAGQAAFSLSRPLCYALVPGTSLVTHPVTATLDGVAQEIVTSAPSAGQVQVDTAAGQHLAILTPPLSAAQVLTVRYYPLHWVLPQIQWSYSEHNRLLGTGQLDDAPVGDYS